MREITESVHLHLLFSGQTNMLAESHSLCPTTSRLDLLLKKYVVIFRLYVCRLEWD